jgi:hypothetical protein
MGIKIPVLYRCNLFTGSNTKVQNPTWDEDVTLKSLEEYDTMAAEFQKLLASGSHGVYRSVTSCFGIDAANKLAQSGRIDSPRRMEAGSQPSPKRTHTAGLIVNSPPNKRTRH